MKIKKLVVALALIVSSSLSYAIAEDKLTTEQQAIVNGAVGLPASDIIALTQQYPELAFAIYETLAKLNPQSAPALARELATAAPDQASKIAVAMVSAMNGDITLSLAIIDAVKIAVPDQAETVNTQVADLVLDMSRASVNRFLPSSDVPSTLNNQQQLANNIQAAVNQGVIHQSAANGLIGQLIKSSAGGVVIPTTAGTPTSLN